MKTSNIKKEIRSVCIRFKIEKKIFLVIFFKHQNKSYSHLLYDSWKETHMDSIVA